LLDDVMSELDAHRRERLVEVVAARGQTVITTTEAEHVPGTDRALVAVVDGQVVAGVVA
jgi:recombinational DNA repair ATPase RecF